MLFTSYSSYTVSSVTIAFRQADEGHLWMVHVLWSFDPSKRWRITMFNGKIHYFYRKSPCSMGKSTISIENHNFQWENPLFLWKITMFNGKIQYFYGKSPFSMGKSTISMENHHFQWDDGQHETRFFWWMMNGWWIDDRNLIPSGKLLQKTMEHHHVQWENPLFRLGHFQ